MSRTKNLLRRKTFRPPHFPVPKNLRPLRSLVKCSRSASPTTTRLRSVARELASTEDALDGVLELLRPRAAKRSLSLAAVYAEHGL